MDHCGLQQVIHFKSRKVPSYKVQINVVHTFINQERYLVTRYRSMRFITM